MKKIVPVSEDRLFQHFGVEQADFTPLNLDELPEESELCARKLLYAIGQTPGVPLDAALLPPLM